MSRSSHWIASGIPSDSGLGSKPSSDLALASVPRYVTPAATRSRSATRRQRGTMVAAARTTAAAGRTKEGGTGIGGGGGAGGAERPHQGGRNGNRRAVAPDEPTCLQQHVPNGVRLTADDVLLAGTTELHGQYVCLGDVGDVRPAVGGSR